MNEIVEVVFGDVVKEWKEGNHISALAKGYIAPYAAIYNIIGDFLTTESSLSKDEGDNLVTIIMAGKKAGAKKMRVKITKNELAGVDASLGKLNNGVVKAVVGKQSDSEYYINIEYA